MHEMVINTLRELSEKNEKISYQDVFCFLEEKVNSGEFPRALYEIICN